MAAYASAPDSVRSREQTLDGEGEIGEALPFGKAPAAVARAAHGNVPSALPFAGTPRSEAVVNTPAALPPRQRAVAAPGAFQAGAFPAITADAVKKTAKRPQRPRHPAKPAGAHPLADVKLSEATSDAFDPLLETHAASDSAVKKAAMALPFDSKPEPKDRALPFMGARRRSRKASGEGLPFQKKSKPKEVLPFRHTTPKPLSGETADMPTKSAAPARDALTGTLLADLTKPLMGSGKTKLTLEQFASLTAEIGADPDKREPIRQRYGLSAAEHEQEQLSWAGKLMKEPGLSVRYAEKLREYRAYLKRSQGKG